MRITHDGFQELEQTVALGKDPVSLEFKLIVAAAHEEVKVTGGQSKWWGHAVGWASYHDQWLSEGFAEFSAALFLENTGGSDW